jgi:hypothetical protein
LALWIAVASNAPFLLANWWCVTGLGGWELLWSDLLLMPFILAILWLPIACVALCFGRRREEAAICALVLGLFVPTAALSGAGRMLAFQWAGERAQPIADAVAEYRRQVGTLPQRLEDLVPVYLPSLPTRIPPLRLQAGGAFDRGSAPWSLVASVPSGFANFDRFFYEPGENYPSAAPGGSVQRLGRWAYYHE